MDRNDQLAWLTRRVCFGEFPSDVQRQIRGATDDNAIARILTRSDSRDAPSPWAETRPFDQTENLQEYIAEGVTAWVEHLLVGERKVEEWMTFFWHHHFAVSSAVVRPVHLVYDHVNTLRENALGNFADLLRDVTIDPAMLRFLDGDGSSGDKPNENYGRELLELYALGIGNYTEDDVLAASFALTGWVVDRTNLQARFRPGLHAPAAQTLLGVRGVTDVDTVIDTVTSHPACASFVAGKLARAILGDVSSEMVEGFADLFRRTNLEIRPLVVAILEAGLAGAGTPMIGAPISWLSLCRSVLGNVPVRGRGIIRGLRTMGQIPLRPPNVGGFPDPRSYLGASQMAGRFQAATALVIATGPSNPCLRAAAAEDWDGLAELLYRPEPFSPATRSGLQMVMANGGDGTAPPGTAALGLALASPEMVVV